MLQGACAPKASADAVQLNTPLMYALMVAVRKTPSFKHTFMLSREHSCMTLWKMARPVAFGWVACALTASYCQSTPRGNTEYYLQNAGAVELAACRPSGEQARLQQAVRRQPKSTKKCTNARCSRQA